MSKRNSVDSPFLNLLLSLNLFGLAVRKKMTILFLQESSNVLVYSQMAVIFVTRNFSHTCVSIRN